MLIPNNTLVLVADGRKRLLFRNSGEATSPVLEVVAHDERADRSTAEIGTDGPGSNQQSGGTEKSGYEATDFHQQAEDRFAVDTAAMLNARALRNEFAKLLVIAPPKTLGELRKHYHKEVASRLIGEIAKDVTNHSAGEIAKLIGDNETKAAA